MIATSEPYPDGTVRTPEELEAAVKRLDRIPLTIGHPPQGSIAIPENQLIGTITQSYDKKHKRIIGEAYYYDEFWKRIPEHLRNIIEVYGNIPISPGFGFKGKENQITNIVPHHVAVLTDEKPLCPLDKCGVNVRMESDSTMSFRYEQRTEAKDLDAPEKPVTKPKEEPTDRELSMAMTIGELKARVKMLEQRETKPVQQEPEAPVKPDGLTKADVEPPEPHTPEEPKATPRKIIPAGATSSEDELKHDPVTGNIIIG